MYSTIGFVPNIVLTPDGDRLVLQFQRFFFNLDSEKIENLWKANLHEKDFALLDLVFNIPWKKLQNNYENRKKIFSMIRDDLQLVFKRKQIAHRNCKNGLQDMKKKLKFDIISSYYDLNSIIKFFQSM